MNLKILEKSDSKISFSVEGINEGFANSLRRIMMNEIPVMAVENVDIEENTSGLFDEVIAHRLSLLPIKFSHKHFSFKENCKCEGKGCSRCEVSFSLEKSGPYLVKASDMEIKGDVAFADNDAPIIELLENQRLKLEAFAQLGTGKVHAKWQSAVAGYRQEKNKFVFSVESVCGLTASEILEKALDMIEEKSEDFIKEINKHIK